MSTFNFVDNTNFSPQVFYKNAQALRQSRIEVYGIRDQKTEKGRDQGTQPWDLDHNPWDRDQQRFSRDQQIFAGSGIKILIVFVIRDENFDEKITSLQPC